MVRRTNGWALVGVVAVLAAGLSGAADDEASRGLAAAAARGDAAQAIALLRQGADPDAADRSGWTGLHQAAHKGDLSLARAFLEAGAHPDLRSRALGTPLDVAERGGRLELARFLRLYGAKGSGKSIGDTVCVRPWRGDGYCAVVEAADPIRYRLRVSRVAGCAAGCEPEPSCSGGQVVGTGGLGEGDVLWVPASCLTHTGVR
jgi:ankyrin repeat protein